ncbi:MAG: succinyldiaminopimelate transaminase [Gammaproteobacteria bacterium]
MNPRLSLLHPYPFERLARLKAGITPPANLPHVAMSIGEPQHEPPPFILDTLKQNLHRVAGYPATIGLPELRTAAARWLERRFTLPKDAVNPDTMVLPVNGTREALFAFVQCVVDPKPGALVLMPNPFYQIYEGASLLAGAEPHFLNTGPENGYMPDLHAVPENIWKRCELLFLCNPGNPAGAIASREYLEHALCLADRYNFVLATDECYAEIYLDESAPPASLLQACIATGRTNFERCAVFHSLSKRSSVPGLRSGFVAGDPALMSRFLLYRTYHGSAMAVPTQLASVAAWNEDTHATQNRRLYQEKFARVMPILAPVMDVQPPQGAFYLWPNVGGDDEAFTRGLFAAQNLTLLPGSYLARETDGVNPGRGRVRISLTAAVDQCVVAAERIRTFLSRRT